jgi:ferric-dicitrate binding protein FerR (iron transport regulator)
MNRSDNQTPKEDRVEEAKIERVLQAAGARAQPSAALRDAVRAAAREEWSVMVAARRSRRRRLVGLAVAASIAIAAFAVWIGRSVITPAPAVAVASIGHVAGDVEIAGAWGRTHAAEDNHPLLSGERLITGPNGRVALAMANGISVRLDHDTQIEFADAHRASMKSGGVYVDSPGVPTADRRLRIETPVGAVEHFGTQYEARFAPPSLRVRVREGRVALTPAQGILQSGMAGEQLTMGANGEVNRLKIDTHGGEWDWVSDLAPTLDIDGRPLSEFLQWAARELGQPVVFATPESEAEASKVVLSGSVSGLSPRDALITVLSTTRLRSSERGGRIVISLDTRAR